ncbi:MAG TPA: tetratricopeptide repeat protein [Caulobacteraceae bacterium]|jgi:tetratricopeptide (TPR) repeat protein|nr:tetratricopeptide repeat protein [Caulobacteraceae bacterium]
MSSSPHPTARALPASPKPVAATLGDASSPDALARLSDSLTSLKLHTVLPLLHKAVAEVRADRHREGSDLVLQALEIDERCAVAWHILAVCREKAGDFTSSLKCYESALELNPDEPELCNDLGRLAYVMGMQEIAEALFARYLVHKPGSVPGINNLACTQRDQLRFEDAIETLRPVIYANPESALLWNTLGTIVSEQGEMVQATTFFDEALRLDDGFVKARYNRANARLALGDAAAALEDCEAAIPGAVLDREASMMRLARSTMLIAGGGDLGEGWDAYEERLNPDFADVTHFVCDRPMWTPETELAGRHLLVIAEQGLGDEVMFANVIPDVLEALGPSGRLSMAVEPRLIPLFRRSFPTSSFDRHDTYKIDHHTVRVVKWISDGAGVDCWAPLASLPRRFRRSVEAFPNRPSYLTADPARVAYWREALKEIGDGPKVGVVWKSMMVTSGRHRYFSPFEQWRKVLQTPGVRFVNLQYGECQAELDETREQLGVEIWNPPGINLKDDLDEVAALSCALDLSIGPANATTNIAAACGAPVWLIIPPGAWTLLGTRRYPWYPHIRVFVTPGYNGWASSMSEVAEALSKAF